ncbi:IS66 family insertion sequence element accessory protein TnpB [Caballeronia sordidicola]|uniref:IS66 family insertion sequence element accessory protein TnpB n=1 Tax=Caballeronia sordidicola TaxID=196367 RepID=UPI00094E1865|nr:IS66 family insertion sequence element accessory protein TnpB [Caballeronia sordidicola]
MFRFEADLKVFLHREPIDFLAGINSLVMLVEQSMQLDPFARAVFAFHNRKRNRIKLRLYERTGFWLMLRRREEDHFVWPRRQRSVIKLTPNNCTGCSGASTLMQCDATRCVRTATRAGRRALPVTTVGRAVTNGRKPTGRSTSLSWGHERR